MHVSSGKIKAIGKAAGPEAPGALLQIEGREYEVFFSEGELDAGWNLRHEPPPESACRLAVFEPDAGFGICSSQWWS